MDISGWGEPVRYRAPNGATSQGAGTVHLIPEFVLGLKYRLGMPVFDVYGDPLPSLPARK